MAGPLRLVTEPEEENFYPRLYRLPYPYEYAGYSYKKAMRLAQDICFIAARSGQVINANAHLTRLIEEMEKAPLEERIAYDGGDGDCPA